MSCETCGNVCCVCGWIWCDLCDSAATHEYQMLTVPGDPGRIRLCKAHVQTFKNFAGTLTELADRA